MFVILFIILFVGTCSVDFALYMLGCVVYCIVFRCIYCIYWSMSIFRLFRCCLCSLYMVYLIIYQYFIYKILF